jgi:hypothetical protein
MSEGIRELVESGNGGGGTIGTMTAAFDDPSSGGGGIIGGIAGIAKVVSGGGLMSANVALGMLGNGGRSPGDCLTCSVATESVGTG